MGPAMGVRARAVPERLRPGPCACQRGPGAFTARPKPFHKLQLPTARVAIEDVAAFLIADLGVPKASDQWRETIAEAHAIFAGIQGRRSGQR